MHREESGRCGSTRPFQSREKVRSGAACAARPRRCVAVQYERSVLILCGCEYWWKFVD
jgi:hypothetical protein